MRYCPYLYYNSDAVRLTNAAWYDFSDDGFMTRTAAPITIFCPDNGQFPNSPLPVVLYRNGLEIPHFFAGQHLRKLFSANNWSNAWEAGIFTYHHYHSITHEAMGVFKGHSTIILGGENGHVITLKKGDLLIIPAGVAHKNLGREDDVTCIGAYPDGKKYDINYGEPGERPGTDKNIAMVPVPESDPLLGLHAGIYNIWTGLG